MHGLTSKSKYFLIVFSCKLLNLVILDGDLYLSKFIDINVTLEGHLISKVKTPFIVHIIRRFSDFPLLMFISFLFNFSILN